MTIEFQKHDDVLGSPYVFVSDYQDRKLEDFVQFPLSSFELEPKNGNAWRDMAEGRRFYIPSLLSGSDYSGSSAERSNFQVFLDQYKDQLGLSIWELYGGYGSYGIAIDINAATEEMKETLAGLADYPLIDEDELSHLEMERENEAWENYLASDFKSALGKKFTSEEDEQILDDIEDDKLFELFRAAMDKTNTYYEHETGGSVYVDLDRVVEGVNSLMQAER